MRRYTDNEAALIGDFLQGSYELIRHETERLQQSRAEGPDQGWALGGPPEYQARPVMGMADAERGCIP
jgi:hypothetical protein